MMTYTRTFEAKVTNVMMVDFITIISIVLLVSVAVSANTTHYVGTNSTECRQCMELSEYTNNVNKYFSDDSTFCFLPGDHYIRHEIENTTTIVVSNIINLSLLGSDSSRCSNGSGSLMSASKIHCISTSFVFTNISGLTIDSLTFTNCGHSDLSAHFHVVKPNKYIVIRAGVFLQTTINTSLSHVYISKSKGFGLLAVNAFSISITNSHFDGNNKNAKNASECCKGCKWYNCSNNHRGGNALLAYTDQSDSTYSNTLLIADSTFTNGLAVYCKTSHSLICSSGGLSVVLAQTTFTVTANITRVNATGNSGYKGGNAIFIIQSHRANSTITIENSQFTKGNKHLSLPNGLIADSGGGIGFYFGFPVKPISNEGNNNDTDILTIKHSVIADNVAVRCGGFCALIRNSAAINAKQIISLENCTFVNNEAIFGLAMQVRAIEGEERLISSDKHFHVVIKDTTFLENMKLKSDQYLWSKSDSFVLTYAIMTRLPHYGTVWLSMVKTNITDCTFRGNNITALSAFESIITVKGTNEFIDNSANNGGGLALLGNSVVYFAKHSNLSFINNSVFANGGAIYVDQRYLSCFFQILYESENTSNSTSCEKLNITVQFKNNKAEKGGKDLYGGYLDGCWVDTMSYQGFTKSENLSECLFNFSKEDNGSSLVSSAPTGVCFCYDNNTINCKNEKLLLEPHKYPGEKFNVKALAVGQRNGPSAAVILAQVKNSTNGVELSKTNIAQQTEINCSDLEYSINVPTLDADLEVNIELSVEGVPVSNHLGNSRIVILTLKPCPPGFNLTDKGDGCKCNGNLSRLQKEGVIICNNTSPSVIRTKKSRTVWISPIFNQDKYEGLLINRYCPLGYCAIHEVTINMSSSAWDDLAVQCCCNRTGLLCGACRTGFSVALGSNECLPCTNLNLLLLIVFIAAGVLLVLALFLCNITVTMGSTNAIIFYANMIAANKSVFFEHTMFNSITVFIDWLNLDLGIKTCFYNGLDMYVKTWMQFLFPLYLLGILVMLIMGSRVSSTLSNLLGNRAVPVLATLFLLSFTKIIRTILNASAMALTEMRYPNGTIKMVWIVDGNISFKDGKYIVLGLTALAVVILLSIPYTLLMLFGQCLQAKSHYKLLRWVNRLKPIYDAYQAPFKPRHRYWTGFLLLIRALLFILLPLLCIGHTTKTLLISLTAMIVIITIFLHDGGMYKSKIVNFLELSIHLNLALLTGTMFYISSMDESEYKKECQRIVTITSVSVVFVTSTVVLLFHCVSQTSFYKTHMFSLLNRCITKILRKDAPNKTTCTSLQLNNLEDSNLRAQQFIPLLTINLREPLLTDNYN